MNNPAAGGQGIDRHSRKSGSLVKLLDSRFRGNDNTQQATGN